MTPQPGSALPPQAISALAAIVRDMRDVPRDCLYDRAELIHWLARMARRVDGVAAMKVPAASSGFAPRKRSAINSMTPAASRSTAQRPHANAEVEAVFGTGPKSATKPVERRTVTSRKGRAVQVETRRRPRQSNQMELWS